MIIYSKNTKLKINYSEYFYKIDNKYLKFTVAVIRVRNFTEFDNFEAAYKVKIQKIFKVK